MFKFFIDLVTLLWYKHYLAAMALKIFMKGANTGLRSSWHWLLCIALKHQRLSQLIFSCQEGFDLCKDSFSDSRLLTVTKRVDLDDFITQVSIAHQSKLKPVKLRGDFKQDKTWKKRKNTIPLKTFGQNQSLLFVYLCLILVNFQRLNFHSQGDSIVGVASILRG